MEKISETRRLVSELMKRINPKAMYIIVEKKKKTKIPTSGMRELLQIPGY